LAAFPDGVALQLDAPLAGLDEASALVGFPYAFSTAKHTDTDVHDTDQPSPLAFTTVGLQAAGPPVGFSEVLTMSGYSTLTHSDSDGQEIDGPMLKPPGPVFSGVRCHADGPPVGFLELITPPAPSTATHSDTDRQETPDSPGGYDSTETSLHAEGPPVGSVGPLNRSRRARPSTHSILRWDWPR
jgi:hypothetical protein